MHFASCSFLSLTIPSLPSSSFIDFLLLLLRRHKHTYAEQKRRAGVENFWPWMLELTSPLLGTRWLRGGLTPGRIWLQCLSLHPVALFCQSLLLMQIGPHLGGGTKSPPPSLSPSVSLCLQHHAPKHSTGKWWEEKLKFANCWEMQREEGVSVSRKSRIFRPKQIFGLHYWKHSDLEQVRFNTDITVN